MVKLCVMTLPQMIYRSVAFAGLAILISASSIPSAAYTNQLAVNPTTLHFGQVNVGQSKNLSVTVTNTGRWSTRIWAINSSLGSYTVKHPALPMTLAAGQSTSFSVVFAPQGSGTARGSVTFNQSTYLAVRGSGVSSGSSASITANPASLSFGSVQTGATATLSLTLKNAGTGSATVAQSATSGSGFMAQGLSLPLTLTAGQSYTFKIAFSPKSAGQTTGSFRALSSSGASLASVSLSGTGTSSGQLSVSPASVSFGSVTVGSSLSKTGSLLASGSSVTISSAGSTSPEFVISGITLPKTLAAGQSASYSVTFKPQSSGAASATIAFASNVSTVSESATGSGLAAPTQQHSVDLMWNPSVSQVSGYNVYRGSKSGGPYTRINSAPTPVTTYTDSAVSSSTTYYYVTTAVNASGQESAYSNQVQASVP
jgi:ASPM-SPD-2-Hydin domain-containing protein/HYDIN/CFA65/VesB family protein